MSEFKNWSGSVQFTPQKIETPKDEASVLSLIEQSAQSGTPMRVVGTGHSFTRLIETSGTLVSLDGLQGLIELDSENGSAHLWGGTKLWKMNQILFKHKRSPENLGDVDRQSIAGTVSTGTHGTGATLGSVSTQLEELTLATVTSAGSGSLITCSQSENSEYFKAAQVSLGSLGIITRVKLKTLPKYKLKLIQKKELLEDVLRNLPDRVNQNRHFEFFTFPYSKYVQSKYMNLTEEPIQKSGIMDFLNEMVLENGAFKVLSSISKRIPGTTEIVSKICGAAVSDVNKVRFANHIYSSPRLVKFQEMEFSVPKDSMAEVVRELSVMIEKKKIRVHFPLECRFVRGDDIWLSPAYGRDSAYIAVHMYRGMPYQEYFEAAQSIFRNHQGRPHWGKMHSLGARELRDCYPMWDRFQEVRKQLDPKGLFMNDATKKLFLD